MQHNSQQWNCCDIANIPGRPTHSKWCETRPSQGEADSWIYNTEGTSRRSNTFKYGSPVVGSHFGRMCLISARIWPGVPRHWLFPSASGGGHPPGFGLGVVLLPGAWGAPKKGMPTGPKVFFLALPDAYGLWPCDRTHLKNGLVPYSCVGGTHR